VIDKSTLDKCLKGVSVPADGHDIVEHATGTSCPREVMSQIQGMPSRTYGSERELLCRLGTSDYCN
jgi:hypothetical protein